MNYVRKSFSVTAPGSKEYADRWEKTFRGEPLKTHLEGPHHSHSIEEANANIWHPGESCSECPPVPEWAKGLTVRTIVAGLTVRTIVAGHHSGCDIFENGLFCNCGVAEAINEKTGDHRGGCPGPQGLHCSRCGWCEIPLQGSCVCYAR